MIRLIKNSDSDNERLSQILTPIDNALKNFDFSNVIVKKPWGYEYLMYQNDNVSIWILHIKSGCLTSMHCHINKKTALIVLSGEAVFTTLEQGLNLKEGDALILDKKVFHSTQAISTNGVIIMEVETPTLKTDLLRLSDDYGRQSKGYESKNEMSYDLSDYEYVFFKKNEFEIIKKIRDRELSLIKFDDGKEIVDYLKRAGEGIGVILNGSLIDYDNGKKSFIGDIVDILSLNEKNHILIAQGQLEILKIKI